ncbi:MAG: PspC domain-containing protein [Limnochordaceae bacterium]|nr:PspC domain-containing protein [Limnochordaceae bacterium]
MSYENQRPPVRRLYRKRSNQMLGGLASGLADYFDVDVSLVRLAWIVLTFATGGAAAVAYIVAWIVVPEEPDEPDTGKPGRSAAPSPAGESTASFHKEESSETFRGGGSSAPFPEGGSETLQHETEISEVSQLGVAPGTGASEEADRQAELRHRRELLGWGLVVVGLWGLLNRFWNIFDWAFFWPVLLILVGLALLILPRRSSNRRS